MPTPSPTVTVDRTRPTDHGAPAVAALITAFAADPVIRWVFPLPAAYAASFPELVRRLGAAGFADGTVDHAPGGLGTAVWVRPGATVDDEAVGELLAEAVAPDRLEAAFALLEQIDAHHPVDPVWYLPFIGVDPAAQGRGIGSDLLAAGLARADRDRLPAYLEASTQRNRALYERHGFTVVGEIQTADSPPLWPMLRLAR